MEATAQNKVSSQLALYSMAAGAFAAGQAQAAPTVSIGVDGSQLVNDGDIGSYFIDLNGDNRNDFQIFLNVQPNGSCSAEIYEYGGYWGQDYAGAVYYAGLVLGQSISGTKNSDRYLFQCDEYGGSIPVEFPLAGGNEGLVGVEFRDESKNLHFGYIYVTFTPGSLNLDVAGGCYEDSPDTNFPITQNNCAATSNSAFAFAVANRTESVPVGGLIPTTLGVLALGAGALRRRRRQSKA